MAQLTIYVDRALGALIREHDIPVSVTCQRALRRAVRIAERRAAGPETPAQRQARERREQRERSRPPA